MDRRDEPNPAKGAIVGAVILGSVALGVLPQFGTSETGAEYVLFVAAAIGAVGFVRMALRHPSLSSNAHGQ